MKARIIGLAAIAGGLALGWFFGMAPLEEARAGAERVSYDIKLFIVAPMLVLMGIFLLVGGAPVLDSFSGPPRTRRDHLLVWPMFVAALAVGGIAWWWFDGQLSALGYNAGV